MRETQTLVPSQHLAATNTAHYPNESAEYRAAMARGNMISTRNGLISDPI
jgi:hypothetical protein